jgi:hypothetical protein
MPRAKVPKGYGDAFLHCRTFGHPWSPPQAEAESLNYMRFTLTCPICGTTRHEVINVRTGALSKNRTYEYPEGYMAVRGEGLARTTYRVEYIRRLPRE